MLRDCRISVPTDKLRTSSFLAALSLALTSDNSWSGIFQITLAFISLYQLLGWTMLVGVAVMILSMPLTAAIARYQTKLQRQQMKNKDSRTRIMSEILNNIRSIKLVRSPVHSTSLEANRLSAVRLGGLVRSETVQDSKRARTGHAAQDGIPLGYFQLPLVVHSLRRRVSPSTFHPPTIADSCISFSSFAMYSSISGQPLTSEIVFPAITLFSLLGFPLAVLPIVFSSLVEAYVSVDRLTDYLCGKELQEGAVSVESSRREPQEGDELLSIVHGDFSWTSAAIESTLLDINLSLKVSLSSSFPCDQI